MNINDERRNTNRNQSTQNDIVVDKLDQLIKAVYNTQNIARLSLEHTLWNTSDVASYIGVTYKYASEYVVTHHTFPNPMRIPKKNGKKCHPRWYASEVINWVAKYRDH